MTARVVAAAALVMTALVAAGCRNDHFCCSSAESCSAAGESTLRPCRSSERPVCDDWGFYQQQNSCVATPDEARCMVASDCVGDRPHCVDTRCQQCASSAHCSDSEPICSPSARCEVCSEDEQCSAARPATPRCGDDGTCVACLGDDDCGGTTPVCASSVCVGCSRDDQCASRVCAADGACRDEAAIVYLDPELGEDTIRTCTRDLPCRTLRRALQLATGARSFIVLAAGDYLTTVGSPLIIDRADRSEPLTIHGPGASLRRLDPGPVVQLQGAATQVTLDRVRIRGGTGLSGDGVLCINRATVVLDGAVIDSNNGLGINATTCAVTVERTLIGAVAGGTGNARGGLSISLGVAIVRNTVVIGNGTGDGPGASAVSGAVLDEPLPGSRFEFNTVIDNRADSSHPGGVDCRVLGVETFAVTSSIVAGSADPQIGMRCLPSYLVSTQRLDGRGPGNLEGRPSLVDGYRLVPGSVGTGAADPEATLADDLDRELRPRPVGSQRDIGADEVEP